MLDAELLYQLASIILLASGAGSLAHICSAGALTSDPNFTRRSTSIAGVLDIIALVIRQAKGNEDYYASLP